RYVFLSDGLLGLLDEDEIAAVFAHELGHVRNGHVWLRAAAMFWPLGVAAAVATAFPHAIEHAASYVEKGGLDAMTALGLAGLAAIVIYVLTFFAFYSRSLEHEADLSVCDLFPPGVGGPTFCSALERLGRAQGSRRARSWQHASIADRVKFLESVERAPKLGLRYRRRIRLVGGIVIGLALSPLIGLLLSSFLLG
ncbi:MAG: M48 family metalloprotease, partial [Pirellulaceae bacterium]|nr:M48 family metalloprotease [Pirellulaceae bacterium]